MVKKRESTTAPARLYRVAISINPRTDEYPGQLEIKRNKHRRALKILQRVSDFKITYNEK